MRTVTVGAALLWCASAAAAPSDEGNPLDAAAILDAGGFFLSTDVRVRLDGHTSGQVGDYIDFDDTFGVGDFDRFRMDGQWRISGRHSLRGTYFKNNRGGSREMSRDIHFGDETYPLGAMASASMDLQVIQLSYDYAFLRRSSYEIAAGIGLHMLAADMSVGAAVSAGGGSVSRELTESGSTNAPLPVLSLRGVWRLPHDFYLTALAQHFYVDIDEYSGSLSDLKVTVVWQATPHVGLGLGYNDFRFRFDIDRSAFSGRLVCSYGGAMAFASIMF